MDKKLVRVSKKLAGLLRHYGPKYGVRIDKDGWASLDDVVRALRGMGFDVDKETIRYIVASDEKGRYEIKGDRIRARYGHSIDVRIRYEEEKEPPRILYHGTPSRNLPSIMGKGLLPGRRLFVHLSVDARTAYETGRRYGVPVAILYVNTSCLRRKNIKIYKASKIIYLVRKVPPECIEKTNIIY